ncbi:MAG: response regulator [Deltaproteobacteria bacterium]|jgi:signal transduction histidine kinase/ActR/RegA family two-component response regulator|nr:response regulator [Deltaproteobacteria bacterium]
MHTIRIKLLAPFILGTLALALVLTGYAYNAARQALADAVLLISQAKSAQASSAINLMYKSMSTTMQNMVADPHILKLFAKPRPHGAEDAAQLWLEAIIHGNDYYRDILIVDAAGTCIASSNPERIGNVYADRPFIPQALRGVFDFDDISVGRVTKKFSVTASGPIDSADGIVGALVLIGDFPKIVDYETSASHDSRTIFTALMNPQGSFIAHKNPKLMGSGTLRFPDLYTELASAGERGKEVQYTLEGDSFIGFAQLENKSRTLVVTSGIRDEVFAPAYMIGFTLFFISFLFLCAISFIVFRFANGILSALLSLIQYAKRVSEGDLELQLEATARKDELGILHNALRSLVGVLQTALHQSHEASRMKGAFLANMSHEIRTPLNAIIGMAHLSLRDGDLSAKQLAYMEKIQLSARSLLGVINDVLDISKVEAGMLAIERIPFNMKETAENALAIHQDNALNKGISLSLEYSAAAPVFLIGDSLRIGQILNNLIGNAIKFTAQGSVSVRCWSTPAETPGAAIMHLSVTDTGIGMSQNVVNMLFQPFTQADASISRKFGGTGLGLAISKRIIELMEGNILAESEEGRGSTFTFFMKLPLAEQQHAEEDSFSLADAFEHLDIKTRRILVAEDNPINQFLLQEMLAPSGAQIVLANNGEEALEAVKTQSFDLVLMDMQMPVMSGLEATMKIRALPTAQFLPIIAVTANAMEEDKNKGFACGMNAYLTKPIDPAELLHALRTWLADGRTPSTAHQ